MRKTICAMRAAIRHHRGQRRDDRCWLDDSLVWKFLPDSPAVPTEVPSDAMERCRAFYGYRRAETADVTPMGTPLDPAHFDDDADLDGMTGVALVAELVRIEAAIRAHRDVKGRPRTLDDDRALYAVLPDQWPADFTLPPEEDFLGEARAPHAGCPAFWRSHADCPTDAHDFHRWGPCPA